MTEVLSERPRLESASGEPRTTAPAELDQTLGRLADHARAFARLAPISKAQLLAEVRRRFFELSPRLALLANRAKGVAPESPEAGEEWFSGPAISLRALRVFEGALRDVARLGAPAIAPGAIEQGADGRTRVRLLPRDRFDPLLFRGWTASAWLSPTSKPRDVGEQAARFYRKDAPEGHVVAVLGGGNVGSISVLDVLYHGFVEGGVCALKMSPVNAYLGPLYERAFAPLIEAGYLALVYGGRDVGAALVRHARVDAVHVTGSIDTHDHIVFGAPGEERERRRRERQPLTQKQVTSELGNVSPVLVVPARYSDRELDAAARNIAGMVIQNASFNCNAAKLVVTARGWPQREALLERLARLFQSTPSRVAYYPGATERYDRLLESTTDGEVQRFGSSSQQRLPWTLVSGLKPGSGSPLFRIEPFCSIVSEAALSGGDAEEFIAEATRFVNDEVWGTLNVMWIAPDSVLSEPRLKGALSQANAALRYGTIGVNVWPAVGYGLGVAPWGGHPSSSLEDAQSGLGFGHNALMLEQVEKVVIEGALLSFPEPFWYPGHRRLLELGQSLAANEAEPGWGGVARTVWAALRR